MKSSPARRGLSWSGIPPVLIFRLPLSRSPVVCCGKRVYITGKLPPGSSLSHHASNPPALSSSLSDCSTLFAPPQRRSTPVNEGKRNCRDHTWSADGFQLRDLPFHLPIAFWSAQGRFHSRSISLKALFACLLKFSDGAGLGFGQPGGKCVNVSLPQQRDCGLGQGQGGRDLRMKKASACDFLSVFRAWFRLHERAPTR